MLLAGTGGEKKIEIRLNNEEEMANPYQLNRALLSRIDLQFFFSSFLPCSFVMEEDEGNLSTNLMYRNEKFPLSTDCM